MIVDDWCEWCDDVFARHAEHGAEESIASSAQQVGVITDARFCDEVNVDVLGHLFEKSVTELEKLREGGLFGDSNGGPPPAPLIA
jgi:hypothetical protein